jgi:hypothetical protein
MPCDIHTDFFDDSCPACRQEYLEMKGIGKDGAIEQECEAGRKYKDFTEERAKKLFEEVMLQYLKSGATDVDAANKAKAVVRKQCTIRGIPFWPWI